MSTVTMPVQAPPLNAANSIVRFSRGSSSYSIPSARGVPLPAAGGAAATGGLTVVGVATGATIAAAVEALFPRAAGGGDRSAHTARSQRLIEQAYEVLQNPHSSAARTPAGRLVQQAQQQVTQAFPGQSFPLQVHANQYRELVLGWALGQGRFIPLVIGEAVQQHALQELRQLAQQLRSSPSSRGATDAGASESARLQQAQAHIASKVSELGAAIRAYNQAPTAQTRQTLNDTLAELNSLFKQQSQGTTSWLQSTIQQFLSFRTQAKTALKRPLPAEVGHETVQALKTALRTFNQSPTAANRTALNNTLAQARSLYNTHGAQWAEAARANFEAFVQQAMRALYGQATTATSTPTSTLDPAVQQEILRLSQETGLTQALQNWTKTLTQAPTAQQVMAFAENYLTKAASEGEGGGSSSTSSSVSGSGSSSDTGTGTGESGESGGGKGGVRRRSSSGSEPPRRGSDQWFIAKSKELLRWVKNHKVIAALLTLGGLQGLTHIFGAWVVQNNSSGPLTVPPLEFRVKVDAEGNLQPPKLLSYKDLIRRALEEEYKSERDAKKKEKQINQKIQEFTNWQPDPIKGLIGGDVTGVEPYASWLYKGAALLRRDIENDASLKTLKELKASNNPRIQKYFRGDSAELKDAVVAYYTNQAFLYGLKMDHSTQANINVATSMTVAKAIGSIFTSVMTQVSANDMMHASYWGRTQPASVILMQVYEKMKLDAVLVNDYVGNAKTDDSILINSIEAPSQNAAGLEAVRAYIESLRIWLIEARRLEARFIENKSDLKLTLTTQITQAAGELSRANAQLAALELQGASLGTQREGVAIARKGDSKSDNAQIQTLVDAHSRRYTSDYINIAPRSFPMGGYTIIVPGESGKLQTAAMELAKSLLSVRGFFQSAPLMQSFHAEHNQRSKNWTEEELTRWLFGKMKAAKTGTAGAAPRPMPTINQGGEGGTPPIGGGNIITDPAFANPPGGY
jgi:hypothetical protein